MPQEFLASFAVDIDEGGVTRLQTILSQNRDMASQLASAFDTARSSMMAFIQAASAELAALPFFSGSPEEALGAPGAFSIDLDFSKATAQLNSFLAAAKKQMKLTADASAIVSAASAALSQARSLVESTTLTLHVKEELEEADTSGSSSSSSSSGFVRAATGGRFTSPTHAEIAEDGDPEYVVPVKKENEAVLLIRSLLSELSASARESLRDALPAGGDGPDGISPAAAAPAAPPASSFFPAAAAAPAAASPDFSFLASFADALASIPDLLSVSVSAPPSPAPVVSPNVSAPVSIRVEAAAADPEAVGRAVYDTAERYLLRTLRSV